MFSLTVKYVVMKIHQIGLENVHYQKERNSFLNLDLFRQGNIQTDSKSSSIEIKKSMKCCRSHRGTLHNLNR